MSNNPNNTVQPDDVQGDRGIPSVNARNTKSKSQSATVVFFIILVMAFGGILLYAATRKNNSKPEEEKPSSLVEPTNTRKFDAPPSVAPPPPPQIATISDEDLAIAMAADPNLVPPPGLDQSMPPQNLANQPAPQPIEQKPRPRLDKGMSELMANTSSGGSQAGSGGLPALLGLAPQEPQNEDANEANSRSGGGLSGLLQGTRTDRESARRLGNRNMTIAKGAMIDCVLQTRIVSTHPGMTSCVTTRDIYSDNGKVLLLERGSLVTGEYQSGIQHGQARLFVLWNRVKTPNGITIDLDSPSTDPLGGSGLPGKVNNHFFQRFGSALLLSMIETGLDRVVQNDSSGNNYYGSAAERSRRLSERTLDANINIPPTLYKRQGERINIFVARDLYFGDVYGLRVYEQGSAP